MVLYNKSPGAYWFIQRVFVLNLQAMGVQSVDYSGSCFWFQGMNEFGSNQEYLS